MFSMPGEDKGEHDATWRELLAKYDMVDAATGIAWAALLDAYKSNSRGHIAPTEKLLLTYQRVKALRTAAEQALMEYMQQHFAVATLNPADT